jgi:hypothetical protein
MKRSDSCPRVMDAGGNVSRIREWAAARKLPPVHLERWLALAEADRDAILAIAESLRLRTGQFMIAFELLDEIRVREDCAVAAILARPQLRRIIDGGGSAPGKARAILDELRAIRRPRLHAAARHIAAQVAELRLPHGIRVVLPPDLGSDELRLEMIAHSGAELEQLLAALAARGAALCRIAERLGGADEV